MSNKILYSYILFFYILFIFLLNPPMSFAQNQIPSLKIFGSDGNSDLKAVNWTSKIEPLWQTNADGGKEFFWAVQIKLPGQVGILNIQAQNSEIGVSKDSNAVLASSQTLFLGMRSLADQILVTLKDNTHLEIKLELIFEAPITLDESCLENNIKIVSDAVKKVKDKKDSSGKLSTPAYMAYRCDPTASGIILSITVPKEVHWQTSSLFESKGKGKNWKNFEVSPQTIASGLTELGNFILELNGTDFPYQITIEKTEIVRPITVFRLSLGMIQLGLKNGDDQNSASKFSSYVLFEMRPFSPNFCFGGEGMTSLPTLSKKGFFNHTESVGYLGYTLYQQKNWNFEPRVYLYLAEGVSQLLKFYYIISTFAIGGIINYEMSPRNSLSLESFFMKTTEQSIFTGRFFYLRKNPNKVGGWGVSLVTQQSGMNLQNPKFGKSTQFYLGPFLEF